MNVDLNDDPINSQFILFPRAPTKSKVTIYFSLRLAREEPVPGEIKQAGRRASVAWLRSTNARPARYLN
jgi:hypothetical protein